jgi:hypothetical protein
MLQVIKDFFHSEKGVFGYAIPLVIATLFVFLDRITEQQWMDFAVLMAGIYTGGKAIQGGTAAISNGKQLKAEAEAAKAEAETLRATIAGNDAAADAALEAKFGADKDGE